MNYRINESLVIVLIVSLFPTYRASSDDVTPDKKKMVDKPTIEFVDFPAQPDPKFQYAYTVTVDVEDVKEKFEIKVECSAPCDASVSTTHLKF